MKVTIIKCICDVCKKEVEKVTEVNYPVIFHTDRVEGRECRPYIYTEELDLCDECAKKVSVLHGWGTKWNPRYEIHKLQKGK